MTQIANAKHRATARVQTPVADFPQAFGRFGRRSVAALSATGLAATAAVAATATAIVPSSVPANAKTDFAANLETPDSGTLVSLDIEWDSGDTFEVKAEEPAPEPEPVVQRAASRSADRPVISYNAPPARMGSVVATAMQYLGYPYVWGATGPNAFDCSGFTSYIYGLHGIQMSNSSSAQWGYGTPVSEADAQPGDLFVKSGHVGIYIGGGQIIHASSPSTGVIISPLTNYRGVHYEFRRL